MRRIGYAMILLTIGAPLLAQSIVKVDDEGEAAAVFATKRAEKRVKVDASLRDLKRTNTKSAIDAENPMYTIIGDMVVVDAIAAGGNTAALQSALEGLGMTNGASYGGLVSGLLPIDALDAVEGLAELAYVRPSSFKTNAGLVTGRGGPAMGADQARTTFGVDGSGVTVGVISDSFDCAGTQTAVDIANDDLPQNVVILDDSGCPGTDEARGMAQVIHDLAPGADIAAHTAVGGQANFATGIIELAQIGCDIIVDDVSYFAEPYFQDGIIAQAVDTVVADRVSYFSAAGNDADQSYESDWRGSGFVGLGGGELHDFDPGPGVDPTQTVIIPSGATLIGFQWDDPFFSVSGAPGADADLDIYIVGGGAIQGVGGAPNIGLDPFELFVVFNPGPPVAWELFIELFEGAAPGRLKYIYYEFGGTFTVGEYATDSSTVVGHPNAEGAAAVGASAWFNTPFWNPFVSSAVINGYSSLGGTDILVNEFGNPTLKKRDQPRIVAPDGVNTTFFGTELGFPVPGTNEPDGFPNFFGTSAAAPHAAGIAALMLDAYKQRHPQPNKPRPKPKKIYEWLERTAVDMDDPATPGVFDVGYDLRTGFGFIDAFSAIQLVLHPAEYNSNNN